MKKKVLSLLLVAAMATSMVACGGEKADNSAANTEAAADNTSASECDCVPVALYIQKHAAIQLRPIACVSLLQGDRLILSWQ